MGRAPLTAVAKPAVAFAIAMGVCLSVVAQPLGISAKGERVALLFGNADYSHGKLKNPVNDASEMRARLLGLGFKVILRTDASQEEMVEALRQFLRTSEASAVRLLYFAGHGAQWRGRNYLIPVDASIVSEAQLPATAVELNEIVDRMGSLPRGVNIIVVDACRNNPFISQVAQLADARRLGTRSLTASQKPKEGLAPVIAPGGTLVAFSTAPGSVSVDSPEDRNSVYTRNLTERLDAPGLPVEMLFKEVRAAVATNTQFQQIPWESSSLIGDFCFRPGVAGRCGR